MASETGEILMTMLWPFTSIVVYFFFGRAFSKSSRSATSKYWVLFPIALISGCLFWSLSVSVIVPEPYLDEIFHIPQARKYCEGKFREWDSKITTPPGLYLSSLLTPIFRPTACNEQTFRATNIFGLLVLSTFALLCRREIEGRLYEVHWPRRPKMLTQYGIHTAFNIALFPLLFFFSGLYYTDIVSTMSVLASYYNHLRRMRDDRNGTGNDILTIFLGIVSLLMRQTNVFWVVVYMGGLEAVHAIKDLRPKRVPQPSLRTPAERIMHFAQRYALGDIHDPPMHMAWPLDTLACIVSLGCAALANPLLVLRQIWPYITVLVSFASFVLWNGGVVLGDKSNHVATIHLAQMLYIWPLFAFFSWPLLLPYALPVVNIVNRRLRIITGDWVSELGERSQPTVSQSVKSPSETTTKSKIGQNDPAARAPPPPATSLDFPVKFFGPVRIWVNYLVLTVGLSGFIVKYNTIIHPFTLADNRHYMFYVFRYTIRRSRLIRYLLLIPYTVFRWMIWGTMAGCSDWLYFSHEEGCSAYYHRRSDVPFMNYPFHGREGDNKLQTSAEFPAEVHDELAEPDVARMLKPRLDKDPMALSTEPASTSTGLIFLLATTLSLVTAPLVEPRYFIIPWVIWRLLVPSWRVHDHEGPNNVVGILSRHPVLGKAVRVFQHYDLRLVFETVWFVAINFVTGYVFLFKPFEWKSEPGQPQRFMW